MTPRKPKAVIIDWDLPKLHLYHIADWHVGSAACREDKIKRLVEVIAKDKYAIVLGGGDYNENIAPSDRRWEPQELYQPITPKQLENLFYNHAMRFCKLVEPIKDKWQGLILGNHETSVVRHYHTNTAAIIAEKLGCAYVGGTEESGWFLIRMRKNNKTRNVIKAFVIHGWGGGELRGGLALKLQRLLWKKDADVLLMSHTHKADAFPESVESINANGYPVSSIRWGVVSFPMVDKHGYIARRGGNPPVTGYTVVKIQREMNKSKATIGVEMQTL